MARRARRGPTSTTGRSRGCRASPREDFSISSRRVGKGALATCPPSIGSCSLNGGHASLCPPYEIQQRTVGVALRAIPRTLRCVRGTLASLLARRVHVDFALDKSPFFGRAQHRDQFLEQRGMFRRVFEPGEKIKGLAEIAAVIELPRDRGQIFQRAGDVVRFCLKDLAPFFLRQLPPGGGFPD